MSATNLSLFTWGFIYNKVWKLNNFCFFLFEIFGSQFCWMRIVFDYSSRVLIGSVFLKWLHKMAIKPNETNKILWNKISNIYNRTEQRSRDDKTLRKNVFGGGRESSVGRQFNLNSFELIVAVIRVHFCRNILPKCSY